MVKGKNNGSFKKIEISPLSGEVIKKHDPTLYRACYLHFKNCKEATELSGLEFENTLIRWNPQKVIKEIQDNHKNNIPLNDHYANKNFQKLYAAGRRYFGSWRNAIEAAGISYLKVQKAKERGYWDKDNFKLAVMNIMLTGKINSSYMQKNHKDVFSAGIKLFGSWNKALKEIDIEVTNVMLCERWTKEKVINDINVLHEQGIEFTYENMKTFYSPLLGAIIRYFGSLPEGLAICNIDYNQYLITKRKGYWTEEKIINKIRSIYNENNSINSGYIMANYKSFYNTARKVFGTWEKAVESAGYDYKKIRNDILKTSYCGYQIEELLDNLFKELNVNFIKYNCGFEGIKPDYILNEFKWCDAKLSEWSVYHSNTLERYVSKINYLWIIYMRGDIKDYLLLDNVRMTHINLIIKQLPSWKQQKYYKSILDIKNALEEIEELRI